MMLIMTCVLMCLTVPVQCSCWMPCIPQCERLQAGGALIGPHALGIVKDVEGVRHLAELGVVFLLFNIGLELSLDRLRSMQKFVFGLGSAQARAPTPAPQLVLAASVRLSVCPCGCWAAYKLMQRMCVVTTPSDSARAAGVG